MKTSQTVGIAVAAALVGSTVTLVLMHGVASSASATHTSGTVLVKEVFGTTTSGMTTGTVSHATRLKGWFVMVRDSRNTRRGNALWGDGWGWSWFDAGDRSKTTTTNYKAQCQACHVPVRASDWIYVDGYPPLKP
jgi:hypothetical protein